MEVRRWLVVRSKHVKSSEIDQGVEVKTGDTNVCLVRNILLLV